MASIIDECIQYFKQPGYLRLFDSFLKKYQSYQKVTGMIKLSQISVSEAACLSGWFGLNYQPHEDYSISVAKFKKALLKSKFYSLDLETILEYYHGTNIITNKQQLALLDEANNKFFNALISQFRNTRIEAWLVDLQINKPKSYSYFISNQNQIEIITKTLEALNNLPIFENNYERIDLFATRFTADPHAFDEGKFANQILKYGIQFLFTVPNYRNKAKNLYYLYISAGLLKDDLSNLILTYHLSPVYDNNKQNSWDCFTNNHEPLWICLRNLVDIRSFEKLKGIYLVENPSIFDQLISLHLDEYGFICCNGQPTLVTYVLLEKLSNQTLYYAGDFDPEGLLIAQKLIAEYPQIQLWHYNDFKPKFVTSVAANRLTQLSRLTHPQLLNVADFIKTTGCVMYQEDLINLYLEDFKRP